MADENKPSESVTTKPPAPAPEAAATTPTPAPAAAAPAPAPAPAAAAPAPAAAPAAAAPPKPPPPKAPPPLPFVPLPDRTRIDQFEAVATGDGPIGSDREWIGYDQQGGGVVPDDFGWFHSPKQRQDEEM